MFLKNYIDYVGRVNLIMMIHSNEFIKDATFPFWIERFNHDHINTPPVHGHDFIELVYVVYGKAQHYIEGYADNISSGDVFIITPGERHTFFMKPGNNIEIINCLFLPELIQPSFLVDFGMSNSMDPIDLKPFLNEKGKFLRNIKLENNYSNRILHLLDSMKEELDTGRSGFSTLIRLRLVEVLILLSRIHNKPDIDISKDKRKNCEGAILIGKIRNYLEQHYDEKITTHLLGNLFNISARHLNRLFKQETGLTVIEMIHQMRIERAKYLLNNSEEKVIDVAMQVGYDDPAFFSRLFRRKVGCSPGRYKLNKVI